MTELLDRISLIPYTVELHNCLGSAIYRSRSLLGFCDRVVEVDGLVSSAPDRMHEWGSQRVEANANVLDGLEAFLSPWARLSMLLYPAPVKLGKKPPALADTIREKRGRTLRYVYDVPGNDPLSDREYRDSWVHADERIDASLADGMPVSGQCIVLSPRLTQDVVGAHLRVIVPDSKQIYIRARSGGATAKSLVEMHRALLDLEVRGARRHERMATLPAPAAQ